MPENDLKTKQEREVEGATGEVIKFEKSADRDQYKRTVDHLRIVKGANTEAQDAILVEEQRADALTVQNVVEEIEQKVLNLERLPLPEFARKLREKRVSQLHFSQQKKAA